MITQSTITCPACGHRTIELMPANACQFFYDCKGCGIRLKPLTGDCCVFCSYGSVACPSKQAGQHGPGRTMSPADRYNTYAEACLRVAQGIADEAGRSYWTGMAQQWLRWAQTEEQKAAGSQPTARR